MSTNCMSCQKPLALNAAGDWEAPGDGWSDPAMCQSDLPDTKLHEPDLAAQPGTGMVTGASGKHYCRRGGYCELTMLGTAPTQDGVTVRLCIRGGEILFTDRVALGLPPQVVMGRSTPLDAEAEQLYREEAYV